MRAPIKPLPSVEYLRACLAYDPTTGELRWKVRPRDHFAKSRIWAMWNTRFAGAIADRKGERGYRTVHIGRDYLTQRVIWKMMTGEEPPDTVDHHDTNRGNNRWGNLRAATGTEQMWNSGLRKSNTLGLRGIHQVGQKWQAQISVDSIKRHLGLFDTPEEASDAYEAAARKQHGDFYRPAD